MNTSPDIINPIMFLTFLTVGLIVTAKLLKTHYENYLNSPKEPMKFLTLLRRPKLYWFCDSDINSRAWADFGSRNINAPNRGYLEIALNQVKKTQPEFDIVPLVGRDAVLGILPHVNPASKQLPKKLWRDFAIANILHVHGGLVMDGDSTLCIGPSFNPLVINVKAATFGINPDESIASPLNAVAPGPAPYVGWASSPLHPAWVQAANFYNALVAKGQTAWTAAIARRANQTVWETQKTLGCIVLRGPDGGRLSNGKLRQLDDLFGRSDLPELLPGTIYVPYDGEDLERRYEFNWFLRLSPAQLMEANIGWTKLIKG